MGVILLATDPDFEGVDATANGLFISTVDPEDAGAAGKGACVPVFPFKLDPDDDTIGFTAFETGLPPLDVVTDGVIGFTVGGLGMGAIGFVVPAVALFPDDDPAKIGFEIGGVDLIVPEDFGGATGCVIGFAGFGWAIGCFVDVDIGAGDGDGAFAFAELVKRPDIVKNITKIVVNRVNLCNNIF